jgi:DNA processing protein
VDNPLAAGPHLLIRDGATLVTKLEDVLDGLGPLPHDVVEPSLFPLEPQAISAEVPAVAPPLEKATDRQRAILAHLGPDPAAVDLLVEQTGLPAQVVLQELTFLTLKGQVRRIDGQTYARRG